MTLLDKRSVTVAGHTGVLVHFMQAASGTTYEKWAAVFGDERATVMVTATVPQAWSQRLSAALSASVLSAAWDRAASVDPHADLPFTLATSTRLRVAGRLQKGLLYTEDGAMTSGGAGRAMFIMAPAAFRVASITDRQEFARRRLAQTRNVTDIAVQTTEEVRVDDLSGWEIRATARDERSGAPLALYQLLLFDTDAYYIAQGLVAAAGSTVYVPEFQTLARSFRRR